MTYLILHKVRGEPAFDIAEQIQIGDELGWIIPTSGHRAYPYKHWSMDELGMGPAAMDSLPPGLPDHYVVNDTPTKYVSINIMSALSNLFPKIKRRL